MQFPTESHSIVSDSSNKRQRRVKTVIDANSNTFTWSTGEIDWEFVIGCIHLTPGIWNHQSTCGKENLLESVYNCISDIPTGLWMIVSMIPNKKMQAKLRYLTFGSSDSKLEYSVKCSKAKKTVNLIRAHLQPTITQGQIMFLLNPFGGTRESLKIFNSIISPLMKIAGLERQYSMMETQYPSHATEIAKQLDIDNFKTIVAVSGDGLFHEIIQGIL